MTGDRFLDLNYVPRYLGSSKKKFSEGERHVSRFATQNVLLLVLDGVLRFEEDGEPVEVKKGEYYVQLSGKRQSGNAPCESPEYIFINFDGRFTKREGRSLALQGSFQPERIKALFTRLKACEQTLKQSDDPNVLFERQTIFFDMINTLYKKSVCLLQKQTAATRIYEYINLHFFDNITLSELSARFGYSRDHVIRVFKSVYRVTPYQYLAHCRICHAKLLLCSEQMTVTEIAAACGYGDYSSFYHAFLHAEGVTPTAFREQAQSNSD